MVHDGNVNWDDYRLTDGTPVPGVTKVLDNLGWKTKGLVSWAYKRGKRGLELYGGDDANIGKIAHDAIERVLKDGADIARLIAAQKDVRVKNALRAYQRWAASWQPELVLSERPMVSERYRYCGRLDLVAMIGGRRSIVDFKTGPLYPEHFIQLSAYRQLHDEQKEFAHTPIEDVHVLHLDKKNGGAFGHTVVDVTDPRLVSGFRIFESLLAIQGERNTLEGR